MAPITVTINYRKPGTLPPLFVSGTFSDWQPQEMTYQVKEDGEHVFQKTFTAEEGSEIQYKFRIGLGDWWALDDEAETVTDAQGNVNNVCKALEDPDSDTEVKDDGDDSPEDSCPLFSHECPGDQEGFGSHESIPNLNGSHEKVPQEPEEHSDDIDYNDPQFEQFPSDRQSILTAIRRIETNTEEDRTLVDGIPPSPVVMPVNSSSSALHSLEPPAQRLNAPRKSLGSFSSSRSNQSLASLQPIEETPQDGTNYAAGPEHTTESVVDQEHEHAADSAIEAATLHSVDDDNATHAVVQQAGPMQPSVTLEVPSDEDEGIAMSTAGTKDTGNGTLRKRNLPDTEDRPATSSSIRPIHETSKNEHWLSAFLRVVFVEWIGGIVSRLCGSRRKALLTLGATVLVVAAFRKST